MRGRNLQNMPYIAATRIAGPYGIAAIGSHHLLLRPLTEFQNNFCLRVKPMDVTRIVIFAVRDEANAIEPNRAHVSRIRLL